MRRRGGHSLLKRVQAACDPWALLCNGQVGMRMVSQASRGAPNHWPQNGCPIPHCFRLLVREEEAVQWTLKVYPWAVSAWPPFSSRRAVEKWSSFSQVLRSPQNCHSSVSTSKRGSFISVKRSCSSASSSYTTATESISADGMKRCW